MKKKKKKMEEVKEVEENSLKLTKLTKVTVFCKCKYCGKEFSNLLKGWSGRLKTHEESCSYQIMNKKDEKIDEYDNFGTTFVQSTNGKNQCEFCEVTFEKSDNELWYESRYHLYWHHFKKEIDEKIYWKPSGNTCPMENCDFYAKTKNNFVAHFIGKSHGILEKYIKIKRGEAFQSDIMPLEDEDEKKKSEYEDEKSEDKGENSEDKEGKIEDEDEKNEDEDGNSEDESEKSG